MENGLFIAVVTGFSVDDILNTGGIVAFLSRTIVIMYNELDLTL